MPRPVVLRWSSRSGRVTAVRRSYAGGGGCKNPGTRRQRPHGPRIGWRSDAGTGPHVPTCGSRSAATPTRPSTTQSRNAWPRASRRRESSRSRPTSPHPPDERVRSGASCGIGRRVGEPSRRARTKSREIDAAYGFPVAMSLSAMLLTWSTGMAKPSPIEPLWGRQRPRRAMRWQSSCR